MRKPLLLLTVITAALLAQSAAASITVPRWLDPPAVDGKCGDPAYQMGASLPGQVSIVHSALDFYLCVGKLPAGTERIAVGLDPDLSAASAPGTGDYVFSFTSTGTIKAERGGPDGKLVPLSIPIGDASAAFSSGSAEVRISLEWLGGYARTAGLGLTIEGKGGAGLLRWPEAAAPGSPRSWGELALAPIYDQGASTGSVFLDGRESYLVVPFAPELNPKELTIEAWVRAVDGDCGTLVGNGQAASYRLALCEGVRFGHGGASNVLGARHPLGDGWHHVAATFDDEGVRTLYVDGAVVLQPGWEPPQVREEEEVHTPAVLGSSVLPLRIGSDRDDPDRDPLHGYVRELRIWDHARSAAEILETAFTDLDGGEPGLVGLWPFTSDLRDLAGGHDAGLIGNASLAREGPWVSEFPAPPEYEPYDYPARPPLAAWKPQVPAVTDGTAMKLDGDCTLAEYSRATKLILEPDRSLHMKMLVAGDSLYLCSNILAGRTGGASSAVTLWIDRDGKPAAQPGSSELRIRLTPDGKLVAGTGNLTGYGGAAPAGLQAKVLAGDRLQAQEDLRPFEAPWWSGEVRIPLKALAPFALGASLRFAIAYDGEAPDGAGKPRVFRERWPASFNELRSDTWGVAGTSKPAAMALSSAPSVAFQPVINSAPRVHVSSVAALAAGNPARMPPTVSDFEEPCTWSLSPPLLPEPRDLAFVFDSDLKWPLVDPTRPIVQVSGTLTKVYISDEDSLFIHTSHDVDMKMTLPLADRWTTVDGAANLVLETESAGFPPNNDRDLGARPSLGDHVTALGRWIFDCGHEPKAEVHPIPMFESDRLEARPLWPGGPQRTVRMVRVWLNSDPEPFSYEFDGPFTFQVDLPPAGWAPFARVVEGDPSRVSFSRTAGGMEISVDPPDRTGAYYFEMMLGHLVQPEDGLSLTSRTATIGTWEIDVLDDHDSLSSGEWFYSVNVNGVWRQLMWDHDIDTGQSLAVLDLFTVSGPDLNFQITGYEEDPTIPEGGGEAIFPAPTNSLIDGFRLGTPDHPVASPLEPSGGDWRLHYHVTPGGEMPASLIDEPFWSPRRATEPNDSTHLSLGVLNVPPRSAPAILTARDGFLTEPATAYPPNGEVELFDADVDRYRFALSDFADVEVLPLPSPLLLDVESWNPWHNFGSLPATLKVQIAPGQTQDRNTGDVIGFAGARLKVSSPDGRAGDRPYSVQVRTTYRELPLDWGEWRDAQGRTVDLTAVQPIPASFWFPEKRVLAADWAWQHIAAETDTYRVIVPPVPGPPPGHLSCRFDNLGRLIVRAHPMTISSSLGNGTGVIVAGNLRAALPNGGAVLVSVTASGARRLYQFEAEWEGSRYYTLSECDELGRQMALIRRLTPEGELEIQKGIIALQGGRIPGQGPWPGPDPVPTDLPPLGDFRVIRFEKGGPLDLIVSSPDGQPILARLFDKSGILVGESKGLDEATAGKTPAPAGLVPHTRLRAEGLEAGDYLLQVVPRDGSKGRQQVPLGFDERQPQ
ncbi:MAG: large repetitive protein [Acidobacteriota bacterium]|nr:large repetitive protein [Acidobacteriota bacterium]